MIERTTQEVEALAAELWPDDNLSKTKRAVRVAEGVVTIEVSQMYEYVPLPFKTLQHIAAFFGTDNIDDDRSSDSGCDTCDWGSSYEITLTIRPTEVAP